MNRLFGTLLVALSLVGFLIGLLLVWERTNPAHQSVFPVSVPARVSGQPDTIVIPSVGIDLPLYPAHIRGVTWDQTTKGASFLTSSPLPGTVGNSIVYGHNWRNLLGPLHEIKPGDRIFVLYGNQTVSFTVQFIGTVKASDVSILAPSAETKLTIYTCTGFLDRNRLVVTAIRGDADSAKL